jgi:membrane-associated phospholipid phosphatase
VRSYAGGVQASVDDAVARWCSEHRHPAVTQVARALESADAALGALAVVGVVAVCVAVWFGGWRHMVRITVVLAAVSLLTAWIKPVVDRPRPPADLALTQATGSAMPSSHALITSAIVVAVVMADWWPSARLRRFALVVGVIGCLVVGAAMVYLGVHWLTDVVVGWAIGVGLTWALMRLSRPAFGGSLRARR